MRSDLPEYSDFRDLRFELQIRTVLQHAWAELAHDRSCKFGQALPNDIQRKLNLYAGNLELVDSGFDEISKEIDAYRNDILERGEAEFLSEEVNSISVERFILEIHRTYQIPEIIDQEEFFKSSGVENELLKFGWRTIQSLQSALTKDFINKYRIYKIEDTNVGFLRTLMLFDDMDGYFSKIQPTWKALDSETYNLLVEKYGATTVERCLAQQEIQVEDHD